MIGAPISSAPIAATFQAPTPLGVSFIGSGAVAAAASALLRGAVSLAGSGTVGGRGDRVKRSSLLLIGSGAISGAALFRIFAATREFITNPNDALPNTPFWGTVQKALRFDRSIIGGQGFGDVTAGWGELELINAEGDYDYLIGNYAIDGRRVVVKIGAAGGAYNGFRTLFDGTATDWEPQEDVLRVFLRDNAYKLEVPASPNLYGGTGGLDGTEELKGKRKPRAFGPVTNVTPPALIPTELVYQVNDGPVSAITAVYDRAVVLAPAGDYASASLLRAATTGAAGSGAAIEAGEYATCLTAGLFRLGGSPIGTVTCDCQGDATGGVYVDSTADIVKRLIVGTARVVDPGEISQPSFDAFNADQPAPVGYWIADGSDVTVQQVVSELLTGAGGFGGFRRNGRFEVQVFKEPSGVPTARYDRIDLIEIARERLPGDLSPTPWRFRVQWGRNWTVQTDVDGQAGVTPTRAAFLREEVRLAEASDQRIRADRPLGKDIEPGLSYFAEEGAALAEAERRLALYSKARGLYRMKFRNRAFIHDIGDVILVTYPRWDLADGRLLRIVSLSEDTDEDTVEIVGFG